MLSYRGAFKPEFSCYTMCLSVVFRALPPLLPWGAKQVGGGSALYPKSPRFWTICLGKLAKKHYKISGRLRRPDVAKQGGILTKGGGFWLEIQVMLFLDVPCTKVQGVTTIYTGIYTEQFKNFAPTAQNSIYTEQYIYWVNLSLIHIRRCRRKEHCNTRCDSYSI